MTPITEAMNTKKLVSRTDYLLPRGLDELHDQSREWLDTLAFWKDETRFFASLLKRHQYDVPKTQGYSGLLANMERLHTLLYDYLTEEIKAHERLLSRIEKGEEGLADFDYRDQHRKLRNKMRVFETDFRDFKKMVFGYARKW